MHKLETTSFRRKPQVETTQGTQGVEMVSPKGKTQVGDNISSRGTKQRQHLLQENLIDDDFF